MPIGYVVTMALLVWCTVFAVAPRQPDHSSPSNLSFRFGFVLNELPLIGNRLVAGRRVRRRRATSTRPPGGRPGAGRRDDRWTHHRRPSRAGRRGGVERALAEGLGARGTPPSKLRSAGCAPAPPAGPNRVAALSGRSGRPARGGPQYGDAGRPTGSTCTAPVPARRRPHLVHVHGGAFRRGHKNRQSLPLLYRLAGQAGLRSVNYRLGQRLPRPFDRHQDGDRLGARARPRVRSRTERVFVAGSRRAGTSPGAPRSPRTTPPSSRASNRDTSVTAAVMLNA